MESNSFSNAHWHNVGRYHFQQKKKVVMFFFLLKKSVIEEKMCVKCKFFKFQFSGLIFLLETSILYEHYYRHFFHAHFFQM